MSQTIVIEEMKTHFMLNISFFRKGAVYEITWKKCGTARQAADENIIRCGKGTFFMPDS